MKKADKSYLEIFLYDQYLDIPMQNVSYDTIVHHKVSPSSTEKHLCHLAQQQLETQERDLVVIYLADNVMTRYSSPLVLHI